MAAPILPGRLGSPSMSLRTDPRADPRLVAAIEPVGLADHPPPSPVSAASGIEELLPWVSVTEEGYTALFAAFVEGLPPVEGVERRVEVIRGVDGNDVTLYLHRPAGGGEAPGVLHLHGGGMVILEAAGPGYVRWRDDLAAAGLVVVGVEFRNGGGKHGPHPFPAGLDDCTAALAWVIEHRAELGITKLVVSGESGGGNLTLATALRAKRDGRIAEVDGVYALCPYISGAYADPPAELTSLVENGGYFLEGGMMGALAKVYDPSGEHARNPLAWPLHASPEDLRGLPPHVISVNQLDPLRDEGLAYFAKLLAAGVPAVSRTVNGTCHAGDVVFPNVLPDVYAATIRDIAGFCHFL